MSDQSRGPGWWQASDGKWYPPETLDQTQAIPTQPAQTYTETTTYSTPPPSRTGLRPWHLIAAAVLSWLIGVVMGVAFGAFGAPAGDGGEGDIAIAASSTTIETTTTEAPTTTVTTARTTTTKPPATTTAAKRFVEVARLEGTSQKRGEVFELSGANARLRYESQAGFFAVYVMDEGSSLQEDGGFPEVTCSSPCTDETQLAKDEGRYYLEVSASGGAWTVIVEEMR